MRHGILILLIAALVGWVAMPGKAGGNNAPEGPGIRFETLTHDFGTFAIGEIHEFKFKFTNTGTAPLVVEEVEQPCGCTIPTWDKAPIMPGSSGQITVSYNSKDRPGAFRKTLAVKTNIKQKDPLLLMIKGNAEPKKKTH